MDWLKKLIDSGYAYIVILFLGLNINYCVHNSKISSVDRRLKTLEAKYEEAIFAHEVQSFKACESALQYCIKVERQLEDVSINQDETNRTIWGNIYEFQDFMEAQKKKSKRQ